LLFVKKNLSTCFKTGLTSANPSILASGDPSISVPTTETLDAPQGSVRQETIYNLLSQNKNANKEDGGSPSHPTGLVMKKLREMSKFPLPYVRCNQ